MKHGIILDIGPDAHTDRRHVSPDGGRIPDTDLFAEGNVADHLGIPCDKKSFASIRRFAIQRMNHQLPPERIVSADIPVCKASCACRFFLTGGSAGNSLMKLWDFNFPRINTDLIFQETTNGFAIS
jgi:hypothetical protein